MTSDCSQKPCNQRFKGVENFLRRVAFNLGNTASQTEVKIISCIPIDVSDLQQKIINLEKQLCEAQEQICKGKERNVKNDKSVINSHSTLVNTAFYNTAFTKESSNLSYCRRSNSHEDGNLQHVAIHCDNCSSRDKKSAVSFVPPPTEHIISTCKLDSFASSNNAGQKSNLLMDRYKNIFKTRIKRKNGKGNLKTHLVYYAQTPNAGFNMKNKQNRKNVDSTEALCRSHLDSIVKKQYDPNVMIEEFSDTSHFTSPICRDVYGDFKHPFDRGSDVCSCCYGKFQNVDNYMSTTRNYNDYNVPAAPEISDNHNFNCDSRDYDTIPVRENALNNLNKKETKIDIDINCWPELLRAKQRNHPFIVNYHTQFIPYTRPIHRDVRHLRRNAKAKDFNEKDKTNKINVHANMDFPSKRGFVEFSDIYKKRRHPKNYLQKSEPVKVIVLKNEITSTNDIDQANTQRVPSDVNTVDDTKTESTLDQIKVMLQNVLTEIKTSGKLNHSVDDSVKRDAVVQKSLNNIQGASTLLNSFTYNNSYSSYSRQIPYCVTSIPYQPMKVENFPVFIHSSPRKHMCMCYCKNNVYKQTNTATNTEKDKQESSRSETEKLIKEIYNSLNPELTTKENSLSEYGDVKSADGSTNTTWKETNNKRSTGVSTNKRDVDVEAILTSLDSYTNYSKTTHSASTQSDRSRTETLYRMNNRDFAYNRSYGNNRQIRGRAIDEDEENEDSTDERESVETVVSNRCIHNTAQDKTAKKSLLKRMFKSVKLFRTKKGERQKIFVKDDEASDSDDYETIYSKQSTIPPPTKMRKNPRKIHNSPANRQRKPYLEQEYRRHWNENLTFHNQNQYSENGFGKTKNTPYWRNYEARNVTIDNTKPNYINMGRQQSHEASPKVEGKDKLKWFKKHKLGVKCGEQWKKFILES